MADTRLMKHRSLIISGLQIVLSICAVFVFSSVILLFVDASPVTIYYHIFRGALGSWTKFSHVITAWIPLTLCACGLLFTFRINLWNIGIEGQVIMGAIFTTAVLRVNLDAYPAWIILTIAIFAGIG